MLFIFYIFGPCLKGLTRCWKLPATAGGNAGTPGKMAEVCRNTLPSLFLVSSQAKSFNLGTCQCSPKVLASCTIIIEVLSWRSLFAPMKQVNFNVGQPKLIYVETTRDSYYYIYMVVYVEDVRLFLLDWVNTNQLNLAKCSHIRNEQETHQKLARKSLMPGDTVDPLNMEPFTVESVESLIFHTLPLIGSAANTFYYFYSNVKIPKTQDDRLSFWANHSNTDFSLVWIGWMPPDEGLEADYSLGCTWDFWNNWDKWCEWCQVGALEAIFYIITWRYRLPNTGSERRAWARQKRSLVSVFS